MVHVVLLLMCAVVIYLACEWFVNAVEWLGLRLRLGSTAVGTVLAAIGTALPESVVTLVAVTVGRDGHGADIGVGAALGGPLVVGTIAYGTVGVALLLRHRRARNAARVPGTAGPASGTLVTLPGNGHPPGHREPAGVDTRRLARDQVWFLAIFAVKVALGLVVFTVKPWLGLAFFLGYAVYFWRELRAGVPASADELAPLKLQPRRAAPSTSVIVTQTLLALAVIFAASQLFVGQLESVAPLLGLTPVVTALLIAPVATELPEVLNALIWVRQGKTELALANISGAMMIQATIPSGLGLLFTPWLFDQALMLAAAATVVAVGYLLILLRAGRLRPWPLTASMLFYGAFAVSLALLT